MTISLSGVEREYLLEAYEKKLCEEVKLLKDLEKPFSKDLGLLRMIVNELGASANMALWTDPYGFDEIFSGRVRLMNVDDIEIKFSLDGEPDRNTAVASRSSRSGYAERVLYLRKGAKKVSSVVEVKAVGLWVEDKKRDPWLVDVSMSQEIPGAARNITARIARSPMELVAMSEYRRPGLDDIDASPMMIAMMAEILQSAGGFDEGLSRIIGKEIADWK